MDIFPNNYNQLLIGATCFLFVAALIAAVAYPNYSPRYKMNEYDAVHNILLTIKSQIESKAAHNKFETAGELKLDQLRSDGYNLKMLGNETEFQIWAVPNEYGKTGYLSYYADSRDDSIHGADHKGEKAVVSDPVAFKIPESILTALQKK